MPGSHVATGNDCNLSIFVVRVDGGGGKFIMQWLLVVEGLHLKFFMLANLWIASQFCVDGALLSLHHPTGEPPFG
jgi:hypothetical protein